MFVIDNMNLLEDSYKNTFNFLKGENNFNESMNSKHKLANTLLLIGILLLCNELKTPSLRNLINNC